jgi:hypothetical protein
MGQEVQEVLEAKLIRVGWVGNKTQVKQGAGEGEVD